jgi:hypothetical protein
LIISVSLIVHILGADDCYQKCARNCVRQAFAISAGLSGGRNRY